MATVDLFNAESTDVATFRDGDTVFREGDPGDLKAVDKKKARLNCVHHLLQQMPYQEVRRDPVALPLRERQEGYRRVQILPELIVPEVY